MGDENLINITVRLGEPIWRSIGTRRLLLTFAGPSVTVADVLARLSATYPRFEAVYQGKDLGHRWPYNLFVNARPVPAGQEPHYVLASDDKLYVFLPAVGGDLHPDPLPRSFFARPTLTVARQLLGQRLVRALDGQRLSGRIVEVEAYAGEDDLASHAARGQTPRNRAMYGPAGCAYVYLIYGIHHCLNVVTETPGYPAAILIRGLEPTEGVEVMAANRPGRPASQLANGPGKLCQVLRIDRQLNGFDLTIGDQLWLEPDRPIPIAQVETTPRIGVRGDARARLQPWRFVVSQAKKPG